MAPLNFRRVVNNIYAGALPSFEDLKELKSRGIKYVLSLDGDSINEIKNFTKNLGLRQIAIPIDATSSAVNDNLKYLNRNIVKILDNYQPIYIHCLHGADRTGLAIALYKIKKLKMPHEQAIAEVRKYGYGLGISKQTQNTWKNLLKISEKGLALEVNDQDYSLNYDITGLLKQIDQINYPSDIDLSFAPFESSPYLSANPNAFSEDIEDLEIHKVPQVGQYNNMAQTRGAGAVEGAGPLNIFQY